MTTRKILKKSGKIILYIIGSVLVLIIAAFIFINTSAGKRVVKNKVQAFLVKKLKTKVVIASIDYSLPKWLEINGIYVEDLRKDTLIYGEKLAVDLNMLKLIKGEIFIRKVELKNILADINRPENDSVFNYQFIADAFAGKEPATNVVKDTAALKLTLKQLLLNDVILRFNDAYAGSNITAVIKKFDVTLNKFQPDRLQFDIDKFLADSINFTMVSGTKPGPEDSVTIPKAESEYALLLNANKIDFKNFVVSVEDKSSGLIYSNMLHNLATANLHVDMKKFIARVDSVRLDSSLIKFVAPKASVVKSPEAADTSAGAWTVAVKNLLLRNNQLEFDNPALPVKEGLDVAHMRTKQISLHVNGLYYSTDSTSALVNQLSFKDKSGFALDTTHVNVIYTNKQISATELYVKTPQSLLQNNIQISYEDLKQLTSNPQNSLVAVKLLNSIIAVNDLYTLVPSVKKSLPPEKFANNVIRLNTEIRGNLQQLYIPFLQMTGLSGTVINAKAILYNVADPKRLSYDVTIFNSSVPKSDLLKFIPQNNKEAIAKLPALIKIGTRLKGDMKNTVAGIDINSSSLQFSGVAALKNFDNPKALQYNVTIKSSRIEKSFINAFIDPKQLPASLKLPEVITASGSLKGDMSNVQPNIKLGGSYGTVSAKGYVRNFKNKDAAAYDLVLGTNNFAIGKLLKQDSVLGNITLSFAAKGRGFDYKTMRSTIKGKIASAGFKQYNYKNVILNADLNSGNIKSNGSINDSSLQMQYNAIANVSGEYPTVEATVSIDTIQLKKLNLYKDTLNFSLNAFIKANNLQPRNLDVYALIDSAKVNVKNANYFLDTIEAKALTVNGVNDITLRSPLADATASGAFDYNKIGNSLLSYINRYYSIADTPVNDNSVQQIAFTGLVKQHPIVTNLVPGLVYENIDIKGSYSSQLGDSALKLSINTPYLAYQANSFRNPKVDVNAVNAQLQYSASFDTIHVGSNILYATALRGNVSNDTVSLIASINDNKNTTRYILGGTLFSKDKNFSFSLSDSLLLNYKKWTVAANNNIRYSPEGIVVTNFLLQNDSSSIAAASQQPTPNSPIDIAIQNFSIRDITGALNADTLLASGFINSKILVSEFDKKLPAFTGNFEVRQLEVMQQPVGTIRFAAQKQAENTISATLELVENGNQVNAKGNYYLNNDDQQFDAVLDIKPLRMATLQGFTKGNMTRSQGSINGLVEVKGKFAKPEWKGEVSFDTTRFTLTKFGTTYAIDKQKISLDYPNISFNKFTINDSLNNPFIIDGSLRSITLSEFALALDLNSRNFTLINAPKAINNQLYGYAGVDANISVSGTTASPVIEGDITLNEKTDVTLVLPEKNINKDAARTVVRFIDRDTFALPEQELFVPAGDVKQSVAQFLNYNLNIQIDKAAALTIVIDPSSGDELKVQGDAQLNAGVDPGGNIVLAGSYLLNSGYYVLNYQFLRKRFELMQGSTIFFAGGPMDAQINMTAEYIANTSAKDLLGNEVGSVEPKIASSFNQKIPFRVILFLKGTLKKPEISFDIQLPEGGQISSQLRATIENKLVQLRGDIASTNKQVFALLALNRFVGEQSSDFFKGNSDGGSGGGVSAIARESVSKFLSAAMDQIASDLFKGVNIDLNLNSYKDFSSGSELQKTDLNVAVSKNFLNDRLSISVGKNFGIEGQDAAANAAQQKGSRFLPDVTVNYKLTTDGKYALRAYNKNQFEVILDGYVVETGVGFIVTMDYDKFRELFVRKKDKKDKKAAK